jgi:excisionase family DNA binding protein
VAFSPEEAGDLLAAVELAELLNPPSGAIEKHYTVVEASALLSIHPDNVYKMITAGEMHAVKFGPRRIRIPESSLRAWMEARMAECRD